MEGVSGRERNENSSYMFEFELLAIEDGEGRRHSVVCFRHARYPFPSESHDRGLSRTCSQLP